MARLLIIDESLDRRLAGDLRRRGRPARSHREVGFTNLADPDVFPILDMIVEPWVLVTGDDFMPAEHDQALKGIDATVATIDGEWARLCDSRSITMTPEEFKQDTVQRWAHSMADQTGGTRRRYNPWRNDVWMLRARHAKRLAVAEAQEVQAAIEEAQDRGTLFP